MKPEKQLQNKIKKYLEDNGAYVIRYNAGMMINKAGIPDLIVGYRKRFIAIEVKTESGKLTELQKLEIDKINRGDGGIAIVVYGWTDFLAKWSVINCNIVWGTSYEITK